MSIENRNLENNLDRGIESSLYILETDTAIKDSLLEGEFTAVLNSRVSYFEALISEKTGALKEFLEQFVGTHASLASENLNLDSLKESGLDVLKLSDLIHNLFIAQQSYLKYLIDLEFYLLTNYPELEERINVFGNDARTLVSADFFGDNLRTLYPNLNNFINSNYESFLTPSDLVLLEQSVSRVARIDLQVGLDFQIETRVENILGNAFEAIKNVGDYPLDPYFTGYPSFSELNYEDFLNSDLGQDLKSMIEAQLSNGYSCEPIVSSIDGAAKDTRTPYKMYTLSLRVFNDIESKDVVIDTTNYYHPYFHGRINDDSLIPFKRMSDVSENIRVQLTTRADFLSQVPEWSGSMKDFERSDLVGAYQIPKELRPAYDTLEMVQDIFYEFKYSSILPTRLILPSEEAFDEAFYACMSSGNQKLINFAINSKSLFDKRDIYQQVFSMDRDQLNSQGLLQQLVQELDPGNVTSNSAEEPNSVPTNDDDQTLDSEVVLDE